MDEQHSHVKTPLQLAERAKHGRDLGRRILIDAGDAYERVEDEKARTVLIEGGFEAPEVFRVLESQRIDIEQIERDPLHGETPTLGEAIEPCPERWRGVIGPEEEHRTGFAHTVATESRCARGHAESNVGSEPCLEMFRRCPEQTHSFSKPQILDEPEGLRILKFDLIDATDRERHLRRTGRDWHRYRRHRVLLLVRAGRCARPGQ